MSIQLHNHPEIIPRLIKGLITYCAAHPEQDFYRGKLFIVEAHRIRIRV